MDEMQNGLQTLCDFAAGLKFEDISEHDLAYLRLLHLDYYAAVLAGYRVNRKFNESVEAVLFDMGGKEESTVLLSGKKLPACNAALLNALYAGGAEMDDGHRRANSHPGSSVFSAVLAMAETLDVTEQDVLTAAAVGYEFLLRLSCATQPGQGDRGFHPSGTTAALACAAACTKLLGGDSNSFASALAAAIPQSSGILTSENFKPLSPSKAAFNGVLSARLVQQGAVAEGNALKKCTRWFRAVSDLFDPAPFAAVSASKLALSECYIKLYPACRHLHGAVDAALALRGRVDPFAADEIVVSLYKSAYGKATAIVHPTTVGEAKFSTAYTAGIAFLNGSFGLDDLEVDKADPRVWELTDKFRFIRDDTLEDRAKGIRGVKMDVITGDRVETYCASLPKGEPETPVTRKEEEEKLAMCSGGLLDADALSLLAEQACSFGGNKRFSPIIPTAPSTHP